jgi:outer membrane protein assembly factor BamA
MAIIKLPIDFLLTILVITATTGENNARAGELNNNTEFEDKKYEDTKLSGKNIFRGKRLSDQIIEEKVEGWSPIIIPLLNYKTKHGLGLGLIGGATYNGNKGDAYFDYAPFVYEISAQAYYSLKGEQDYYFSIDMPYFLDTPVEVISGFDYNKSPDTAYFGVGPESSKRLMTRYGAAYRSYAKYNKRFLNAYDPFNPISPLYTKKVNYKYNEYKYNIITGNLSGYVPIAKYFKFLLGYNFKKADADSWAGHKFNTPQEQNVISSPTLIDIDPAVIAQKRHGLLSIVRFGIGFDTRDFAPDPRSGVFIDYTISICSKSFGADFNYTRSTAGARFYYSPVRQLTFAARVGYTTATGNIPFYELGNFSFLMEDQPGLGNDSTLRGFQYNRFIGDTMTVGNLEVRWEFVKFQLFKQKFALKLLGFVDAGSVFNHPLDPFNKWSNYHIGYGPGFIVAYNLATIIHFYLGLSKEDMTLSFDFNHAF